MYIVMYCIILVMYNTWLETRILVLAVQLSNQLSYPGYGFWWRLCRFFFKTLITFPLQAAESYNKMSLIWVKSNFTVFWCLFLPVTFPLLGFGTHSSRGTNSFWPWIFSVPGTIIFFKLIFDNLRSYNKIIVLRLYFYNVKLK